MPAPRTTRIEAAPPPAAHRSRIAALDIVRGFALCGILLVNIRPIADTSGGLAPRSPAVPVDTPTWLSLLLDQRFFPIFSLLFGVGFALLLRSAAERVARPRLLLLRRLLVLLGLGLVHLLLLWPGDILTTYAVVGLAVLLPSTWLPRWAVAGLAAVLLAAALILAQGGNTMVPGLFLLGSALVRYGVIDRMERSTRAPAALGFAFAAAAAPALRWQVASQTDPGDPRSAARWPWPDCCSPGCTCAPCWCCSGPRSGRRCGPSSDRWGGWR